MQREGVLVVSVDHAVYAQLGRLLRDEGFVVKVRPDAASIEETIRVFKPALLVLSVPGKIDNAVTVLQALHGDPSSPAIIVLSSHHEQSARRRIFELGALDFVSKPVDARELAARVRSALQHVTVERATGIVSVLPLTPNHGAPQLARADGETARQAHDRSHLLTVATSHIGN